MRIKNVLLIVVKVYTRRSPDYKNYRKKIAAKITKRKTVREQACQVASFSSPGGIEGTSRLMPFFFI